LAQPEKSPIPVDVVGELDLSSPDGAVFTVRGRGSSIEIVSGNLGDLFAIKKLLPSGETLTDITKFQSVGRHGDVTFRLLVRQIEVGRLSPHSRGNWVSRLFGWAPAEVRLGGIIRTLVDRRSAVHQFPGKTR
jgi:hypothetical protein